jgi:hypothetical protein
MTHHTSSFARHTFPGCSPFVCNDPAGRPWKNWYNGSNLFVKTTPAAQPLRREGRPPTRQPVMVAAVPRPPVQGLTRKKTIS